MPDMPPVIFIIPTWNDADTLNATLQSIREQDCDPAKLFFLFTDFASTDGTLDIIRGLPRERVGFFDLSGKPHGRTMQARATRMSAMQIGGRPMVLWPGDTLRPSCIATMEYFWDKAIRQYFSVNCIVAEVEVLDDAGAIYAPPPLFTGPALLRSYSTDTVQYVDRGWRRQILRYGCSFTDVDKPGTYHSHVRHWNQLAEVGAFSNILYLPDRLARQRRYDPPDELDDLLFRFEMALTCFRMMRESPETHVPVPGFEASFRRNLGKYALWRAWITRRRGDAKTAEDCFLMARVINPELESSESWRRMEHWLAREDEEDTAWITAWFAREEAPEPPKWPFGGMARRWQRQWKLWRTGDGQSALGR